MNLSTFVFAAAFIALAGLLLWILIGSRGPWQAKLALIVIVPSFGIAVWSSMDSILGWPTSQDTPRKALLQGAIIQEPGDLGKGDPGRIQLWLVPMDGSAQEAGLPKGTARAFVLPYSRKLHKAVQKGMDGVKRGQPTVLERRKGSKPRRGSGSGTDAPEEYRTYDLPPHATQKDGQQ